MNNFPGAFYLQNFQNRGQSLETLPLPCQLRQWDALSPLLSSHHPQPLPRSLFHLEKSLSWLLRKQQLLVPSSPVMSLQPVSPVQAPLLTLVLCCSHTSAAAPS